MRMLLATLVLALAQEEQAPTWIARKAMADGAFDHATRIDVRGDWTVAVQEFPERTLEPMAHRPDVPWRLVRQRADELEELASDATAHSGWGAPSWLAVGEDGTVVASWRPGHKVLRSKPGDPTPQWTLHSDSKLECAALRPNWIAHWDRTSHGLSVTPLGPDGPGERRHLAGATPPRPDIVESDGEWLAWIDGPSTLRWIAVTGGEPRELKVATEGSLAIDGLWSGVVLLRAQFGPELGLAVELASGTLSSFELPSGVVWVAPEGAFTQHGLYDPLDGSFVRCESTPSLFHHAPHRAAPGRFFARDSSGWFELSLHTPRARVPAELGALPTPHRPPAPALDAAQRSLWLSLRAR
jgi:hypothetical protein